MTITSTAAVHQSRVRVYVFGVPLHDYVESFSFDRNDGEAPSSGTIVLGNPSAAQNGLGVPPEGDPQFSYTPADIEAIAEGELERLSELKRRVTQVKMSMKVTLAESKASQETYANGQFFFVDPGQLESRNPVQVKTVDGQKRAHYPKYSFEAGEPIFHPGDPVRIAMYDPHAHDFQNLDDDGQSGAWYWKFSGFVTDKTLTEDFETGRSTIQLRMEDTKRMAKFMRFVNPGFLDNFFRGYPTDIYAQGFPAQLVRHRLTVPEVALFVLLGPTQLMAAGSESEGAVAGAVHVAAEPAGDYASAVNQFESLQQVGGVNGLGHYHAFVNGVGGISLSSELTAPDNFLIPTSSAFFFDLRDVRAGDLVKDFFGVFPMFEVGTASDTQHHRYADYQRTVDDQVRPVDLAAMRRGRRQSGTVPKIGQFFADVGEEAQEAYRRVSSLTVEEIIHEIGTHPELYPVQAVRVIGCFPGAFQTDLGRKLQKFTAHALNTATHKQSRLSVMLEAFSSWDFSFHANGRGDYVVEMPFRDLDADDFLPISPMVSSLRTRDGAGGTSFDRYFDFSGRCAGALLLQRSDLSNMTRSSSDEDVRTEARYSSERISVDAGQQVREYLTTTTVFPELMAMYGVRNLDVNEPFVIPFGLEESANARAAAYASVQLAKTGLQARRITLTLERPFLGVLPNRPVELFREFRASVRNTSYSWTASTGKVTVQLALDSVFHWDGTKDQDGRPIYVALGGTVRNTVADYRSLLTPGSKGREPVRSVTQSLIDTVEQIDQDRAQDAFRARLGEANLTATPVSPEIEGASPYAGLLGLEDDP